MLQNINQPKLCNGTRLVVSKFMNYVIYATILKGKFEGEEGLIPRIPMIPTNMPFEFKRLQFSIRLAFAMTKSQSEFLKVVWSESIKSMFFLWSILYYLQVITIFLLLSPRRNKDCRVNRSATASIIKFRISS